MSRPARRRWFRYSLRMLFVFLTVLGLWLGQRANWIQQRRQAIRSGIAVPHTFAERQVIPDPPLGFRLMGEEGERHLFVAAAQFDYVCELFPESDVIEYPLTSTSRHRPLTPGGSRISTAPCSPAKPRMPKSAP